MAATITLATASGTLEYNGIRFLVYSSKMSGEPVYDDAGRMVKWVAWTVEVEAFVNEGPGVTTDATLKTMRQKLTQPGAILRYDDKGFGAFVINEGVVQDVNWGPKPKLMSYVPIGNTQYAHVVWKCTAHIPECPSAIYKKALMMADYTVKHTFDSDGYCTQSISGALEIPLTFKGAGASRLVTDDADKYRHLVWFPEKPGYFRKDSTYTLSMDRRRLEFSIVDEEIPIPLPNSLTYCKVNHKVKSSGTGFVSWTCDFTGTMRVTPTRPRSDSLARFLMICLDRINHTRRAIGLVGVAPARPAVPGVGGIGGIWTLPRIIAGTVGLPAIGPVGGIAAGLGGELTPTVIVTDLEIDEDIFGREDKFRLSYRLIVSNLADIARASGLWKPVDGTSWVAWQDSIKDSHGIRGHSRVGMRIAGSESLVDLCDKKTTTVTDVKESQLPRQVTGQGSDPQRAAGVRIGGSISSLYPPETSWLYYKTYFVYNQEGRVVWHEPLDGTVTERTPSVDPLGQWRNMSRSQVVTGPNVQSSQTEDLVQRISPPAGLVVLQGVAARVFHQIPIPELLAFEGKAVTEVDRSVVKTVIANYGDVPVYGTAWRLVYKLSTTAARLPVQANPALQYNAKNT